MLTRGFFYRFISGAVHTLRWQAKGRGDSPNVITSQWGGDQRLVNVDKFELFSIYVSNPNINLRFWKWTSGIEARLLFDFLNFGAVLYSSFFKIIVLILAFIIMGLGTLFWLQWLTAAYFGFLANIGLFFNKLITSTIVNISTISKPGYLKQYICPLRLLI